MEKDRLGFSKAELIALRFRTYMPEHCALCAGERKMYMNGYVSKDNKIKPVIIRIVSHGFNDLSKQIQRLLDDGALTIASTRLNESQMMIFAGTYLKDKPSMFKSMDLRTGKID